VVDDFTRECLALVPDTSLSGARVVRELDMSAAVRGKPTQSGGSPHKWIHSGEHVMVLKLGKSASKNLGAI
jgi:hypothetical protein